MGIFLMSLTFALLAYAGSTIFGAVQERMNAEPRSFEQRERVQSVNVVTVTPETIVPVLTVFGELRSRRSLDLRAPVGGTVIETSDDFVEGGRVGQGDVLLRIDPTEAEDALSRVRADLQDAQAERRDAERALMLARDTLAASEAQAALRDRALQRQRDLQERGIGTTTDLESAELAASSAAQAVLSSRQSIAQAEARMDQADTLLERTRINLAQAERTLADTVVTAAFDGTLAAVGIGRGGRVTANEQIAQLVDPALLEVAFRVSTSQYATLLDEDGRLLQAPVLVALEVADLNLTARGTISREGAVVGAGQTGRQIFARLDAAAGFRPGDFVTVAIEEPALDQVARLPATALAADQTVLVVADEDRLQVAPVQLLRRQGNDILVRAPDLAGATVVAERSPLLGAGIRVRPILPADPDAPAAEPELARMILLDDARRARLVAFIQGNDRMPSDAKSRLLSQLEAEEVPAEVVTRLESRMGS
jgi:multidrug efflux pump subunit AcrA (membrane-fusion protein)